MKKREPLAAYAHDAWSRWMQHLFTKATVDENGRTILSPEHVERWRRQMETPYASLSESEKSSDRKEADRMIAIFHNTTTNESQGK